MCENFWFFSWVNTHPFDLKFVAFCPKFSGDSWVEFKEKTIPGEFFRNFVKTKAILYRNLWNFGLIYAISFWVRIALKKIHTGTFVCYLHPEWTKMVFRKQNVLTFLPCIYFLWFFHGHVSLLWYKQHVKELVSIFLVFFKTIRSQNKISKIRVKIHKFW